MSDPNIIYNINWTLLISVIAVSCAAMGTLVEIKQKTTISRGEVTSANNTPMR